jgi:hypothetical protein
MAHYAQRTIVMRSPAHAEWPNHAATLFARRVAPRSGDPLELENKVTPLVAIFEALNAAKNN